MVTERDNNSNTYVDEELTSKVYSNINEYIVGINELSKILILSPNTTRRKVQKKEIIALGYIRLHTTNTVTVIFSRSYIQAYKENMQQYVVGIRNAAKYLNLSDKIIRNLVKHNKFIKEDKKIGIQEIAAWFKKTLDFFKLNQKELFKENFITGVDELAVVLNKKRRTLYRMLVKGQIPTADTYIGKQPAWKIESIKHLIKD